MTGGRIPSIDAFNNSARETHAVDPDRLAMGQWDDEQKRDIGEGDIHASYSADVIAMMGKVRKSFIFQGQPWVGTNNVFWSNREECGAAATAYRLVPLNHFKGKAVSYAEKTLDCNAARADPNGFYHGIRVLHRGQPHVLCGPPVNFIPGPTQLPRESHPGLFPGM